MKTSINTLDLPPESHYSDNSDDEKSTHYHVIKPESIYTNENLNKTKIKNYCRDSIFPEDEENGWKRIVNDEILDYCPLFAAPGLNLDTEGQNSEDFFYNLFNDRMFAVIAETTNDYAHKQIRNIM